MELVLFDKHVVCRNMWFCVWLRKRENMSVTLECGVMYAHFWHYFEAARWMSRTLILLQVYFYDPSDVWEEDLSMTVKRGRTDIIYSISVGGRAHTHVAGSGRPHHITTKMSLWPRLSRGSCGTLIPNISIPSPVFSVSLAIGIAPITGFLSYQKSFLHCSAVIQSRVKMNAHGSIFYFSFASLLFYNRKDAVF